MTNITTNYLIKFNFVANQFLLQIINHKIFYCLQYPPKLLRLEHSTPDSQICITVKFHYSSITIRDLVRVKLKKKMHLTI